MTRNKKKETRNRGTKLFSCRFIVSSLYNYKFHILIFIFSVFILTRFNIDPDLGWHLVIGQKFIEGGEIMRGDQLSWTMPGYLWGNSYFIYQILVAYLFNNFGHIFTAIFFGLIGGFAILVLLPKRLGWFEFVIIGLGLAVAQANLGVRPHMVSFLMFAFLLVLLEKKFFETKLHVLFWFNFFVIWANFHRGFLVGFFVLTIFVICDFIWQGSFGRKSSLKYKAASCCAALAGTLVTPFSLKLWHSAVFVDLTSRDNLFSVAEWQSIVFYFPSNLFFAATGLIFVYILYKKFKEIEPQWFLTASILFALAFVATNFAFFWAAIFIFTVTRSFKFKLNFKGDFWAKFPLIFSFSAVGLAIFLGFVANLLGSYDLKTQLIKDGYPLYAVKFLEKNRLVEGLFNDYSWGGFIDWQYPQAKVFIDGRMASWRNKERGSILGDYLQIIRGKCGFARKYEIKTLLVKKDFDTRCFANWTEIYRDSVAKILAKNPNK